MSAERRENAGSLLAAALCRSVSSPGKDIFALSDWYGGTLYPSSADRSHDREGGLDGLQID